MDDYSTPGRRVDEAALDAAAEETTIAQYRALVMLASRGPERVVDLSGSLGVAPSTAGRMCDRLARKGLIRRHRARADRRAVLVSVTPAGRLVVDQATARRRELIEKILGQLPVSAQQAVGRALREFADAAGEVPGSQRPAAMPARTGGHVHDGSKGRACPQRSGQAPWPGWAPAP